MALPFSLPPLIYKVPILDSVSLTYGVPIVNFVVLILVIVLNHIDYNDHIF